MASAFIYSATPLPPYPPSNAQRQKGENESDSITPSITETVNKCSTTHSSAYDRGGRGGGASRAYKENTNNNTTHTHTLTNQPPHSPNQKKLATAVRGWAVWFNREGPAA